MRAAQKLSAITTRAVTVRHLSCRLKGFLDISIDWADQKHDWAWQPTDGGPKRTGQFAHTPEAMHAWVAQVREAFGARPVAVALEQSRGPLLFQLMKYPNLVLYPVHPNMVANYRKSFRSSGAKSGPCIRTRWKRARGSFWWRSGVSGWMTAPVSATG